MSRRHATGRGGRSRRGMGAAAADAVASFNASDYVPADLQNDVATGRAYYDAFQQAASGVSFGPHGSVQLSPAVQEAVTGAIEATVLATFSAAIPGAGAVLALAYALAPKAGAGPGICTTDPPPGPYLAQLQAWPHFTSYQSVWGAYAPGAPGSFEAYAYPTLEYNWIKGANCFTDKASPAPILLGSLIASWNAIHTSASTRTICRTVIPSAFAGQQYDPIAFALSEAMYARYTRPLPPAPTFEDVINQQYTGPRSVQACFQINTGPLVVKTLVLHLRPTSTPLPVAAKLAPEASAGAGVGELVALVAAGGAAVWFGVLGKPLPAFVRRLF